MRYLEDIAQERLIVSDLKLDQIFLLEKSKILVGQRVENSWTSKKKIQQVGGWNTIE